MGVGSGALDEALRESEFGAEEALAAGHLAGVGLVVVAGQVQQTVENKHLDFSGERVALFGCVAQRRGDADGEIAGDLLGSDAFRRER
jgi:hypothetical protein